MHSSIILVRGFTTNAQKCALHFLRELNYNAKELNEQSILSVIVCAVTFLII